MIGHLPHTLLNASGSRERGTKSCEFVKEQINGGQVVVLFFRGAELSQDAG
jgi:hypothetical protein